MNATGKVLLGFDPGTTPSTSAIVRYNACSETFDVIAWDPVKVIGTIESMPCLSIWAHHDPDKIGRNTINP